MNELTPHSTVTNADHQLTVRVDGLTGEEVVVVTIRSDRNQRVTRDSDVSPLTPQSQRGVEKANFSLVWAEAASTQTRDLFYPAIDLDLGACSTKPVALIRTPGAHLHTVNSWRTTGFIEADSSGLSRVPASELEHWENWVLAIGAQESEFGDQEFALEFRPAIDDGQVTLTVPWLGKAWAGSIEVSVREPLEGRIVLESKHGISAVNARGPYPQALATDIGAVQRKISNEPSELETDLALCLDFIEASENTSPDSRFSGGLFLFYDLDGRMWRTPNWTWTWSPAIKVLLEAPDVAPSLRGARERYAALANRLGELTLDIFIDGEEHPAADTAIARWDPLPHTNRGSEKFASLADALFLGGWGWSSLHDATGDPRYAEALARLARAATRQIETYGVVQQDWLFERERWLERILDEAGFGTEGLAEHYRITGDPQVLDLIRGYMDPLIERLGRDDGLWDRFFYVDADAVTESESMTRGLGWAMEGLLACHRATRDERYLDLAKKMAEHMMKWQREDGAWTFQFDRDLADVGFSDKGTPLWSVLMYRLHSETGEDRHLESARAAAAWSRSRLRRDEKDEAMGGIVGIGPQSGIAYRHWFRQACTYSSAFTAQAIIYELSLQQNIPIKPEVRA
ncbi:hypothetical protein [Salinibacterium sp. PAMC 21357]|uniref:hypothetical protein n=1 Tax=Salinibacterium sp. PAMC 21357 TaxID=1112215 RepID=UPI0002890DF5|nr:hypothetical protein [Salinibacterium sp. PAMC 21357]